MDTYSARTDIPLKTKFKVKFPENVHDVDHDHTGRSKVPVDSWGTRASSAYYICKSKNFEDSPDNTNGLIGTSGVVDPITASDK